MAIRIMMASELTPLLLKCMTRIAICRAGDERVSHAVQPPISIRPLSDLVDIRQHVDDILRVEPAPPAKIPE